MKRNSSSSFYDGKNDVTCRKTGEAAIEAALSREMRQNHERRKERGREEKKRKDKRKKKGGREEER